MQLRGKTEMTISQP